MPSIEQLHRLLAADPNDPFTLYALAQEHAKRGEWVAAIAHYDRCLAADPAYCYAYYHKAKALDAAGDRAGARAAVAAGLSAARLARDQQAMSELGALEIDLE